MTQKDWPPNYKVLRLSVESDLAESSLVEAEKLLDFKSQIIAGPDQLTKPMLDWLWQNRRALCVTIVPKEVLSCPWSWCLIGTTKDGSENGAPTAVLGWWRP